MQSHAIARLRGRRARLLALGIVAALAIGVVLPVGLMEARLHPVRVPVRDDPGRHGLPFQVIEFPSIVDSTVLRGWYLPAPRPTGRTVVIAPGIDANREMNGIALGLAPALLDAGFDVLAFDLRAEGESDGTTIGFGWEERWDVLGAVAEARRRGAERVAVLGFSLGGAATILAAAEPSAVADGPQHIDAVIADSAFARLDGTLRHGMERQLHLPDPLASYGLVLYRSLSGTDPARVAPVEAIPRLAPRPLLLIHGSADATVEPADCRLLAAAAHLDGGCWLVPGADHTGAYDADPAAYADRVLGFLGEALPAPVGWYPQGDSNP